MPHRPFVEDLDTGIVYGPAELFWPRGSVHGVPEDRPLPLRWEPLPASRIVRQLEGRVAGCRVAPYQEGSSYRIQTTLVVEH